VVQVVQPVQAVAQPVVAPPVVAPVAYAQPAVQPVAYAQLAVQPIAYAQPAASPAAPVVPLLEGWLTKQAVSATVFKNWRRRWIVLRPHRIEWHRERGHSPPAGEMRICGATSLRMSDARPHSIALSFGGRELLLQAEHAAEMQRWYDALASAISASG